jgi:DNA polymerase III subunit gamma/tau
LRKKKEELGTPSISQALSGKFENEVAEKVIIPEYYARETRETDHNFTEEQLLQVWPEFAEKYVTQVHLYNTLSVKPVLLDHFKVKITVENSVQQDQIRMLKPEIIGFLCRKLNNSKIDVNIEMVQSTHDGKMFTDEQKMQAMMMKNPALQKMKNIFNLDFNR